MIDCANFCLLHRGQKLHNPLINAHPMQTTIALPKEKETLVALVGECFVEDDEDIF